MLTHGTDTMTITAEFLQQQINNKLFVLTSAMTPIKFDSSDSLFNLGCAIAFAQTLPPGIYVAMNGRVFKAGNVRKNKETGLFEEII
ncbi:MAG: asparaginase domain-containing protein [Sediminibacterium sp.]|uniref:asparaginase domain-containing protein n=1 Tax=Sediminibacterium sp. TaxID=1917865 RepID=UPI00273465AD|nr:asparaginase domain-containing protein [Sediminibacterium sp.]MDP3393868.1 asparaginase domain-containing protein [Sediminibacterium sp.]MDP3568802.1 asparaginase domain-containing protein [Sediminibacterium sp.]